MENQRMTADKTPEQIQQEMSQTREALTEKVAALENQVVGTVQTAADTLTGTVESVKSLITTAPGAVGDSVKQAAAAVSETMKKTFDISGHVREHPWASVGISALCGCMTGWLISSIGKAASAPAASLAATPRESAAPREPGVFDELLSMVGRKLREAAEGVIDSASAALNKNVREGVPKLVDAATELAADRLTPAARGPSRYAGFPE